MLQRQCLGEDEGVEFDLVENGPVTSDGESLLEVGDAVVGDSDALGEALVLRMTVQVAVSKTASFGVASALAFSRPGTTNAPSAPPSSSMPLRE